MGSPNWILMLLLLGLSITGKNNIIMIINSCAAEKPHEEDNKITNDHECGFTTYPTLCHETLTGITNNGNNDPHVADDDFIISILVNKTIHESQQLPAAAYNFEKLSSHFISPEAQRARMAIGSCHELMKMSLKRLNQALDALKESPKKYKHDIQTWLSAALTFQQDCKDLADDHANLNSVMSQISKKMEYLSELGSNPLSLVNRITEANEERRLSEDGGPDFPHWVSPRDRKLLQSTRIKANVVVAKDGTGDYETVSEAVKAASGGRFVIYVKAGVYNEQIRINKGGITLIGEGKYSTILSSDNSVAGGSSLTGSASLAVYGDNFIAKDIGFQNTAGPQGQQAVAIDVSSDHSVLYRCSIVGYQDSLYAHALRQFYRECDILGTIDFIFGNAAAVFQSCNIILRKPRSGSPYDVILANGRTDPGQNTGFSVQNCRITTSSDFSGTSYLGRPWKAYSRAVIMQSSIDGSIGSRGWVEWPGYGSSTLKSLYFGEYANIGSGAGTSGRVQWPGFHILSKNEATQFTVANFISGTSWLPSTGVTFMSGL